MLRSNGAFSGRESNKNELIVIGFVAEMKELLDTKVNERKSWL
jgi:hypothetical protein